MARASARVDSAAESPRSMAASSATRSGSFRGLIEVRVRPLRHLLADDPLMLGEAGHLRQVGHAQDLPVRGELRERTAQDRTQSPPYARVDLVEDEGRHAIDLGKHGLRRQGHAGKLAARRDFPQRPRLFAGVGREHDLDVIRAVFAGRRRQRVIAQVRGVDLDVDPRVGQAERLQVLLDGAGEFPARLPPRVHERRGGRFQPIPGLAERAIQERQVGLVVLDRRQLRLDLVAVRLQGVGRAAEPRREPAIMGQSGFDGFQALGVVVAIAPEVPQDVGEIADLAAHAGQFGRDLGQLGHAVRQGASFRPTQSRISCAEWSAS